MAVRPLDESSVEKKLRSLTNTQDSIQGLSLWIIHHKAHHEKIVELWFKAMKKADYTQRLTLLYLCNDIVQTCKRKHAIVYKDAFKEVLKDVALLISDGTVRHKVERIFGIWLERNVYDQAFTDELVAILNNTQVKTTVNCKLLSEFKPEVLIDKVNRFKQLTTDVELKRRQLVVLSLDASRVDAVQQLKDRAHGHEFSRQFEESCQKLDDYVHFLEVEIKDRADLIEMLEQSEIYYDAQYGEAKIVANAYKNFGTRVNNLRKKLIEYAKTLPDPVTASPVPSPSMDAPSPGNTPPEEQQECDNRETVDMELSDEDGDGVTIPGIAVSERLDRDSTTITRVCNAPIASVTHIHMKTSNKRQHLPAAGSSPRLEDRTTTSSHSPDDGDLDLFKLLPTLSKGARSSFLSGSSTSLESVPQAKSQHDPRQNNTKSLHPNIMWNATHGFTTGGGTEGDLTSDSDPVATVNEGNLLQLTEGDSTPVKDEGRSTPVLDEKPDEGVANPIEFLTQLISQGKKGADGTASSFMQSLSALTSTVKSQMTADSGGSPLTDMAESTSDSAPNSWAAWKAKQDPPAPAENGTQDQHQAAPSVAQRMQQPIPPPVAPPVTFSQPMAPQFPPRPPSQPGVPPNYRPTAGSYEHLMSTPQPVPPPPQMPLFPQPTPPPTAGMWQPVRPPMFPPGSLQPPPPPSGVVSPTEPMPSGPGSLPHLVMPTAPGGSGPPNFNTFPSPDSAGQTSPGVSIPTVGGVQPQRPQFPPPPPQPPSPFGGPGPTTPGHVTSPTALEEEQNEFIRKLKRKTGISTIPTTPPTPPVGILKSSANSNLRTLTQVQEEAGDGGATTQPEVSAASDMVSGQMDLGSSIQTIQSVHGANNSNQFGMDDRGAQNSGYRQGQHRQQYNPGNTQYGQYRDDHEQRGNYRREGYRRGFERDAFHRDSYGRLPPKRPPPKFEPGGYYQRY